ncbi:MAG: MoxR family ATPase [Phormidium sp. BM_Day4_Bin.17]|nr:MoxR family ATPase [Phormidium sp. BM_Day4_Bin.17]UCJ13492.1 MAG: MoxR family ATPase [Phormidium sp. PBR-2020]
MTTPPLKYLGEPQYQPQANRQKRIFPYLPNRDLVEAVNLAIALERPLFLQGEPGCGKTLLAPAIAHEFGQRYLKKGQTWPYFRWNIKSTSTAKEGCYIYDALGKLRDAQLIGTPALDRFLNETEREQLVKRLSDPEGYLIPGAMGRALQHQEHRPILLIDEIDKADIDFPNDLLSVLEENYFTIDETQKRVPAEDDEAQKPIVIITSNQEQDLPEAFLRRCLFFYLPFPDKPHLTNIVKCHFPESEQEEIINKATDKFLEIRAQVPPYGKKPSTSELLDWLTVLIGQEDALAKIDEIAQNPAYAGILLKSKGEYDRLS